MTTADTCELHWAVASSVTDQDLIERAYLRYIGVGVEYFAALLVPTLLGLWLDARFHTAPALTIVFVLLGFAAATWNLIRSVASSSTGPSAHSAQRTTSQDDPEARP